MKKFYTLLLLSLFLLPATAKAETIYPFWVVANNGSIEIYSDAAYTNLVIADYGSEDGVELDVPASQLPDGMYIRLKADDGFALGTLDILNEEYKYRVVNGECHVDFEEIIDPEGGLYILAWFEEPRYISLIPNEHGSLKAFFDVNLQQEIKEGQPVTDTDFDRGVFIQATPKTGCQLETLTVNGEDVTADMIDDIYIIFNPFEDVEVSATFSPLSAGVEEIATDVNSSETQLFDLKGNRINAADVTPGFYILRQGDKSIKVYLKK